VTIGKARPVHVVLWGGRYGSHAVGDQALLLAMTELLQQASRRISFTVLSHNPSYVQAYMSKESACSVRALNPVLNIPELNRTLAECDMLVIDGGVPLFDNLRQTLMLALMAGLARYYHTPYFLWSVSAYPLDAAWGKVFCKWLVMGASWVTCRDQYTRGLFESCGVKRDLSLVPDSSFCLSSAEESKALTVLTRAGWKKGRPLFALTPRALPLARARQGKAQFDPQANPDYELEVNCYAAALDWLWSHGYWPIFVPMNTEAGDDNRISARHIVKKAANGESALMIGEEIRPGVAPEIYRLCFGSFVSREDACIMSAVAACPSVMYTVEDRHTGVMELLGQDLFILRPAFTTPEKALDKLHQLVTQRETLRQQIIDRVAAIRKDAAAPAQLVNKLMRINQS
jgi:polysaccharide pyruvyl transferase WcaK-like protein